MSTEKKTWHDAEEKAIQCLIAIADHIQGRVERDELEIDAVLDAAEKAEEIARFSRKMQMHREITCREKLYEEQLKAISDRFAGDFIGCPGEYWKGYPRVRGRECSEQCEKCWNMPYTGEKS